MITNNSNYSLNGDSLIGLSVDPQAGFNLGIVTAMHLTKKFENAIYSLFVFSGTQGALHLSGS